jgi:hypothetical protein
MARVFEFAITGQRLAGWRAWLATGVAVLALAAVAALAFALFLILAPIVAVMIGWQIWRIRRAQWRDPGAQWRNPNTKRRDPVVIDAGYEVLSERRRD